MSTLNDRTHVEKDRKYLEILSQKPCMGIISDTVELTEERHIL